ncbi:MAG: hypothetical protein AAF604_21710 [Acidobacteriota bacterium]
MRHLALIPWTRLVVVASAALLLALFASSENAPTAALESSWLTAVATLALLASAFVGGRFFLPAALLLPLTILALPAGPGRGTVVGLLAVILVVSEGYQACARDCPRWSERFALLGPLALALHGLLRGPALLQGGESWERFALLPLAAAAVLALIPDLRRSALAGAAVVVLAPGFNLVAVLTLGVLAAGDRLRQRPALSPSLLALGLLAALFLREPRAAVVALAAALVLTRRPLALASAGVLAVGLALGFQLRPWPEIGSLAAFAIVLMPLVLPTLPSSRRGWPLGLALLAVWLAAGAAVPGAPALVAPLALVALLAEPAPARTVQGTWTCALLTGTALAAGYPWLRLDPLGACLRGFGMQGDWDSMALALLAMIAFAWLGRRFGHPLRWAAIGLTLALALTNGPRLEAVATGPPWVLDQKTPRAVVEVAPPLQRLVLSTHLAQAAELPPETEVARLSLLDIQGNVLQEWPVASGVDTNEWAARRSDLAALPQLAEPVPWSGWLAAGDPPFFGALYRADFTVDDSGAKASHLVLRRNDELPEGVEIRLFRVEVKR